MSLRFGRAALSDFTHQYGVFFFQAIVGLGVSLFLARHLSPERYGYFATALSASAIFAVFVDGGYRVIIQRSAATSNHSNEDAINNDLRNALGYSLLVSLVIAALGSLIFSNLISYIVSICFLNFSITLVQYRSAYLKGKAKFKSDALFLAGTRISSAIFIIATVTFGILQPELILVAWAVGLLVGTLLLSRVFFNQKPKFDLKAWWSTGSYVLAIELFNSVTFRFDVLIAQFAGVSSTQIGNFAAALRLVEGFILLAIPLRAFLFYQFRHERLQNVVGNQTIKFSGFFLGMAGLLLALPLSIYAEFVVNIAFGEKYSSAASYFSVLVWILFPIFTAVPATEWILANERERYYALCSAFVCIIILCATSYVVFLESYLLLPYLKIATEIFLFFLLSIVIIKFRNTNKRWET